MKKSELKAGYVVKLRNGEIRILMPVIYFGEETLALVHNFGTAVCQQIHTHLNENLMVINGDKSGDIMEVYGIPSGSIRVWQEISLTRRTLLWSRPAEFKLTSIERTLLSVLPHKYKYIARDNYDKENIQGNLFVYTDKPILSETARYFELNDGDYAAMPYPHLFNDIKEAEMYVIKDILEDARKNDE